MRDKDNMTPLQWACKKGHKEIVQYLVEEVKCDVGELLTSEETLECSDHTHCLIWSDHNI